MDQPDGVEYETRRVDSSVHETDSVDVPQRFDRLHSESGDRR